MLAAMCLRSCQRRAGSFAAFAALVNCQPTVRCRSGPSVSEGEHEVAWLRETASERRLLVLLEQLHQERRERDIALRCLRLQLDEGAAPLELLADAQDALL